MPKAKKDPTSTLTTYIVYFIFIILITAFSGLVGQKYAVSDKNDLSNERQPPQINTGDLPDAKAGTPYKTEIFASTLYESEIIITASNLPVGLQLTDCTNQKDVKALPETPNTLAICSLQGVPETSGKFNIVLDASTKTGRGNSIKNVILTVEE